MRYLKFVTVSFAVAMALRPCLAQEFEVAAIKPYVPRPAVMGKKEAEPVNPAQIRWAGSLRSLIVMAFAVRSYQVSGPEWLDSERFTIAAKPPAGTIKEQIPVMWQRLLSTRFGMTFHRALKEIPHYEVAVVKKGVKMKVHARDGELTAGKDIPGDSDVRADGCYLLPAGRTGLYRRQLPGRIEICGTNVGIEQVVREFAGYMDRPLIDGTGLRDKYDFKLEFAPDGTRDSEFPSIYEAMQGQLGLHLIPGKMPMETIVIDSIQKKPTEN